MSAQAARGPRERPTSRVRRMLVLLGTGRRTALAILVFLLLVDVLLIAAHAAIKIVGVEEYLLDLGVDRGYGEFWQYIKYLATSLLLVTIGITTRSSVAFAWTAVTAYLAIDDALGVHEGMGARIALLLPQLGGDGIHVGEIIWLGGVGALLAAAVVLTHRRTHAEGRAVSLVLGGLFAGLIVFGIGVDALHHLVFRGAIFDAPFTAIEDGGELLLMSLVVAFVWAVGIERHRPVLARSSHA